MEKNRLTDEQLEGVTGGRQVQVNMDGMIVELGGPETYLKFSEYEKSSGYAVGYPRNSNPSDYYDWYYSYYGEPHPWDQR